MAQRETHITTAVICTVTRGVTFKAQHTSVTVKKFSCVIMWNHLMEPGLLKIWESLDKIQPRKNRIKQLAPWKLTVIAVTTQW